MSAAADHSTETGATSLGPDMDWYCATCGLHRDEHRPGYAADQCAFDPVLRTLRPGATA